MPSSAAVADDAPPGVRLLEEEGGVITLEVDEPPGMLEPDYRLTVELPHDHPILRSHSSEMEMDNAGGRHAASASVEGSSGGVVRESPGVPQ